MRLTPSENTLGLIRSWNGDQNNQTLLDSLHEVAELILEANQRMNLTSDDDPVLFWQRHIEDALLAAQAVREALGEPPVGGRLLDVGSGSGIPGLVWGLLWPCRPMDLLEARRKRGLFLQETAKKLRLVDTQVLIARAEDAGRDFARRERYAWVCARALAPMPTLAELTLPLVRVGGILAAIKSADVQPEVEEAASALRRLGADPQVRLLPYTRSDGKACMVCLVRKIAPTPQEFPRLPGVPAKRPLTA